MKRGDIVTVASPGDYGKPRPAVIVQNDDITGASTLACLISSDPGAHAIYRLAIEPNEINGLRESSFVMTEKLQLVRYERCGGVIGRLSHDEMAELNAQLAYVLALGSN